MAPPSVIAAIAHCVSLTDGVGNVLTEDDAVELIKSGELRRHGRKALQSYAGCRSSFAAEINRTLGDIVDHRMPDGDLAFCFKLDTDLDKTKERAAAMDFRFVSSRSFLTNEKEPRGLRIGFAGLNSHEAHTALSALREAAG